MAIDFSKTQVVLLAGGLGTRIREETSNRPKPMIEIGGHPILWHLMKNFSSFGIRRFVICAGYRSDVIVDYFTNFLVRSHDFTLDLRDEKNFKLHLQDERESWEITVVHTGGSEIGTGGRLNRAQKYIDNYPFICTYGDGLSDVNVEELISIHKESQTIGTITVTNPTNRFGVVELEANKIRTFREKPKVDGWINSGYFVFNEGIWDYLDDSGMLEDSPLQELAVSRQLSAFKHNGFWQAMDTYRELQLLENLWSEGHAPWKNW
jgi:glucose-1-phosphate cytidylyltransferase